MLLIICTTSTTASPWTKHERLSIAVALAEKLHHHGRREVNETHKALRSQKILLLAVCRDAYEPA